MAEQRVTTRARAMQQLLSSSPVIGDDRGADLHTKASSLQDDEASDAMDVDEREACAHVVTWASAQR